MRIKNTTISVWHFIQNIVLLISPVFAVPFIIPSLLKKNLYAIFTICILYGLLEYQIIPFSNMDLAKHYTLYESMASMNWGQFLQVIKTKPDFLFYTIMLAYAKIGFGAQFFSSTIVAVIFWNFLHTYHVLFSKVKPIHYAVGLLILLLTFQYSHLLLGLRNYLAFSFILIAFRKGIISGKGNSFFYFLAAICIHFSSVVFIPIYLILKLNISKRVYYYLFLLSILFIFIDKQWLYEVTSMLPLSETLSNKITGYLDDDDIVQLAIKADLSAKISFLIQFSWIYFALIYLVLSSKISSNLRSINYTLFMLLNLFTVAPDPYNRFAYLVRPIFFFLLFDEAVRLKKTFPLYLFSVLMLIYALVDFYITKNVYIESFISIDSLFTILILLKEYYIIPV